MCQRSQEKAGMISQAITAGISNKMNTEMSIEIPIDKAINDLHFSTLNYCLISTINYFLSLNFPQLIWHNQKFRSTSNLDYSTWLVEIVTIDWNTAK